MKAKNIVRKNENSSVIEILKEEDEINLDTATKYQGPNIDNNNKRQAIKNTAIASMVDRNKY